MEESHFEKKDSYTEIPAEKQPGFRNLLGRPTILAALTILIAAIICFSIAVLIFGPDADSKADLSKIPNEKISPANSTQQYEEVQKNNLEDLVKRADLALIRTLEETGVDMKQLQLEDVTLKRHEGRDYHYQQLRFPAVNNRDSFIQSVKKKLTSLNADAKLDKIDSNCWMLSIEGINTHKIFMDKARKTPSLSFAESPKMAIVIDDMGEDVPLAEGLAATGLKITFSIWPSSSHAKRIAELARRNGNEIMIHMPMQPQGYPKVNPGKDALLDGMKHDRIKALVNQAIKNIPGAVGMNNHMGSRFTENLYGMKAVMQTLKKHGIFFLDSKTTPNSICRKASAIYKLPMYERNIFLDNVKDVSAIEFQLEKAEKIALKHGQSIAIGHPHHQTLEAIKKWAKNKDARLYIVPVDKLVPITN
ncbi:divergent polysaccharide deacetylase family protein [Maridesulfovibrio bastinii]|uniref:divergent polysaccharide deacetylase family protein n=1 Tax=Maridesulfovibrio bastinii TaxID=47157 RepID=UPI0003F5F099|nr:divergent polysaccharide deacetylase family protein [Maridesulfovibrio bastinii]